MEPSSALTITVNGEPRAVPAGGTILDLLSELGLDPERVAVELNRRIVRKAEWPKSVLTDGSRLEIVQFVGGG
jgi:thiamine biosynthesis protein ThiS